MAGIDRHLAVLGCGLVGTAALAFGVGLATASWLRATPGPCAMASPTASAPAAGADRGLPRPSVEVAAAVFPGTDPGGSGAGAPAAGSAPSPGPPPGDAAFRVQVGGGFLDRQVADAVAARLASLGYPAGVESRADRTGLAWHAPVVGAYARLEVAARAARDVARRVGLDARAVPAGGSAP